VKNHKGLGQHLGIHHVKYICLLSEERRLILGLVSNETLNVSIFDLVSVLCEKVSGSMGHSADIDVTVNSMCTGSLGKRQKKQKKGKKT